MEQQQYVSVIGGINMDITGIPAEHFQIGTSNPGTVSMSAGGVGRNIAHNLALLGIPVYLFGAIGKDMFGAQILDDTRHAGVNVDSLHLESTLRTGIYVSILDAAHDLAIAVSDMEITHRVNLAYLDAHWEFLRQSRFLVLDTNLDTEVLQAAIERCRQENIPCLIEPVSVEKARKLNDIPGEFDYVTPNLDELEAFVGVKILSANDIERCSASFQEHCRHLLVTLGEDGVWYADRERTTGTQYPAFRTHVVNVNGAGDAFVAGFISGQFHTYTLEESIRIGMAAASLTLQSPQTVNPSLSFSACISFINS